MGNLGFKYFNHILVGTFGFNLDMNPSSAPEFHDDYEHVSNQIEYILENELMAEPNPSTPDYLDYSKLKTLYNTSFASKCNCFELKCWNSSKCSHGGNYILASDQELLLNPKRPVPDLIYECFDACKCRDQCGNRLLQFGPRTGLTIVESATLGPTQLGLVSQSALNVGAFVCEYAGEILTAAEAERRHRTSKPGDMNYIVCLIERSTGNDRTVHRTFIDPSKRGNIGRYLNHSCEPNCEIVSVRVDGPIPRLGMQFTCFFCLKCELISICFCLTGIFTNKYVAANEELCFDYGIGSIELDLVADIANTTKCCKCLCGSERCRGQLPNLKYN